MNANDLKRIVVNRGLFPSKLHRLALERFCMIQHPVFQWKILVLCSELLSMTFYIFDTRTNVLKSLSIHNKKRYLWDPSLPLLNNHVLLRGTKQNTVIVIGTTPTNCFFYGVIDAAKHRWRLIKIMNRAPTATISNWTYSGFPHYFALEYFGYTTVAIVHRPHAENWIILVNTGLDDMNKDKTITMVSIYELEGETEYPNTCIGFITLEIDLQQHKYLMIQIPSIFRKFEEKDEEAVILLFFAFDRSRESMSIFELSILVRTCDDVNRSILYSMQKNPKHWIGDLFDEAANSKSRQLQCLLCQPRFATTVGRDSRYLVVFCTTTIEPQSVWSPRCGKIVYYDRHSCHWNVVDYIFPQKEGVLYSYTMDGNKCAYIFNKVNEKMWQMRKVEIDASINWKLERVIWIGYHKNYNCYFAKLAKDIVFYMLQFLRNDLLWS